MSNTTDGSESYENGQQREEEALAVISEFSESSNQNAADPPAEQAAEAKENNDKHDDQEQQQPAAQPQDLEGGGAVGESEKPEQADLETGDNQDKPKLTAEKGEEGVIDADKNTAVEASTVLVETQEVVTSSTANGQQRKHSSGRIRTGARRASYQTSRSYAGGSFQNYGLTYLPYRSNFEPSEDARRRADEFFKTLKL